MRLLLKLALLSAGIVVLAAAGWELLSFRPLGATPPVPGAATRARAAWEDPAASLLPHLRRPADESPWVDPVVGAETPPLTETENLLLAGLDTRPELYGGRTDALVIVVLDQRSPQVGLISVPRDLWVNVPGHEPERLNSVYATGSREGGHEAGSLLLRQVIRNTLGLPISTMITVDHAGFEALVDQLEGISVLVRCPIRDRFLDPRGPDGRLELKLAAGVQHLDGRTALMYSRSRHGRGIFDRALRQQAVLLGLRDRLLELGSTRIAQLLPALRRTVYTDLSLLQLVKLARRLAGTRREQIHGLVLSPKQADISIREDGRWVMIPKPEELRAALQGLFQAPAPGHRQREECPDIDAALKPAAHRPASGVR